MFINGHHDRSIEIFPHNNSCTVSIRTISPNGKQVATVDFDLDDVLELVSALQAAYAVLAGRPAT